MNPPLANKPNRNDACPCGSGKKYKICCAQQEAKSSQRPPADLHAWQQRARQAMARAEFAEAEHWYRQLVTAKPNDAALLIGLGEALCFLHRRREGLGYLLKAAKLLERQAAKTREPQAIQELSSQLLRWGEAHAAERLARLALAFAPNSPAALQNLALCLARVNRHSEALPFSQRVCEKRPDDPKCHILLALLDARLGRLDEALKRLQQIIEKQSDRAQTARAWLETGVILDKLGRFDEAFVALTHAAETHSAMLPHGSQSREHLFNVLQSNEQGFNTDLLRRWPPGKLQTDGLPSPVFLMGFLRSGTTLTEQILGIHPRLFTTDETNIIHELNQELEAISGLPGNQAAALKTIGLEDVRHLRKFYWRRLQEEYGDELTGKQVIDKNALNTLDLGIISVVFPEAKILFALRDPRDVCLSCFMQAFSPTPATINLFSWQGIARQYAAVMGYWLKLRGLIQPHYLELRYEDTVENFEATYRQVFAFLGVEWHPEVSRFHERNTGRYVSTPSFSAVSQALYSTALARWKPYESQFAPVLPQLEPFIKAFGYSTHLGPSHV